MKGRAMTVLVGRTRSLEGQAAMEFAVEEARRRGEALLVFDMDGALDQADLSSGLEGLEVTFRSPDVRGRDAAGDLLDVAEETEASVIVIGVRHRSPVGKLLLGSNAQEILLGASAPVIAVKTARPAASGSSRG